MEVSFNYPNFELDLSIELIESLFKLNSFLCNSCFSVCHLTMMQFYFVILLCLFESLFIPCINGLWSQFVMYQSCYISDDKYLHICCRFDILINSWLKGIVQELGLTILIMLFPCFYILGFVLYCFFHSMILWLLL